MTKGTTPIIGATKPKHVFEAAKAKDVRLTREEVAVLESAADAIDVDTRGEWEHTME